MNGGGWQLGGASVLEPSGTIKTRGTEVPQTLLGGVWGVCKYKLIFGKNHPETITLPAPSLFYLSAGKYLVSSEPIHAYRNPIAATEPEPESKFDPPRQSDY